MADEQKPLWAIPPVAAPSVSTGWTGVRRMGAPPFPTTGSSRYSGADLDKDSVHYMQYLAAVLLTWPLMRKSTGQSLRKRISHQLADKAYWPVSFQFTHSFNGI